MYVLMQNLLNLSLPKAINIMAILHSISNLIYLHKTEKLTSKELKEINLLIEHLK